MMDTYEKIILEQDAQSSDSDDDSIISFDNVENNTFRKGASSLDETKINNSTPGDCPQLTMFEIDTIKQCDDPHLKNALILNRKKKYTLVKILNRLKNHKQSLDNQKMKHTNVVPLPTSDWNKKLSRFRLGMPYFKDYNMYSCPHNDDYYKMQKNNELPLQSYCAPRPWTLIDKLKLALAVYKFICNEQEKQLNKHIDNFDDNKEPKQRMKSLLKELSYLKDKEIICNLANQWNNVRILTDEEIIEKKTELQRNISFLQSHISSNDANYKPEILEKLNNFKQELKDIHIKNYIISLVATCEKVDWLYISCNDLDRHNDLECKFLWESYINPKNSKDAWTEEQNTKLIEVVKKHKMQNWQSISEEINFNKSAYQCCIHFFSKLWEKCRRLEKWTKEEDLYLTSLVNMFQIDDYIPWAKISKYFVARSKTQIYIRYKTYLATGYVKGGFTLAEDILMCALLRYCKSYSKAAYFFPNRRITQLRYRFKNLSFNYRTFTFEDDIKILKHVEKYGESNWNTVKIDRSPCCIRHRYSVLKKWILQNPGKDIQNVIRRNKSKESLETYLKNKNFREKIVNSLLSEVNNGKQPTAVFNLEYIKMLIQEYGNSYKKKVTQRKKKPKETQNLNYFILEFLKFHYHFKGRQRLWEDNDCSKGAERINGILNTLGANLKIPNINTLQENPLLDEIDIKILSKMSNTTTDPVPSTSSSGNTNSIQNLNMCLPPDPITLIGFRGILLHASQLKNNASNYFFSINRYLPEASRYDVSQVGIKLSAELLSKQLENLPSDILSKVRNERSLFEKRFRSVFKWPAIMSLPANTPQEHVFTPVEPVEVKPPIKKVGRPAKITSKIKLMVENKKRKRELEKQISTEKKCKTDTNE